MKITTVLLADNHLLFAQALQVALSREADIQVVGLATNGAEAVEQVRCHQPDVVLLDYRLPGTRRMAVLGQIRQVAPQVKVVFLTAGMSVELVVKALEAGAVGYLPKEAALNEVVVAVRAAAAGEIVLPSGRIPALLAGIRQRERSKLERIARYRITERELQVLECLVEGMENEAIGERLVISPHTVRTHVQNLFTKLGAHSKAELLVLALREGLVEPP